MKHKLYNFLGTRSQICASHLASVDGYVTLSHRDEYLRVFVAHNRHLIRAVIELMQTMSNCKNTYPLVVFRTRAILVQVSHQVVQMPHHSTVATQQLMRSPCTEKRDCLQSIQNHFLVDHTAFRVQAHLRHVELGIQRMGVHFDEHK